MLRLVIRCERTRGDLDDNRFYAFVNMPNTTVHHYEWRGF